MPDPTAIIAIVGKPATGKSYWRKALAKRLGWSHYDIADQGEVGIERWSRLLDAIEADDGPVIVESCASPARYRALLNARPSLVLEATAPAPVRRRRLAERGLDPREVKEWMRMYRRPPSAPALRLTEQMNTDVVATVATSTVEAMCQGPGSSGVGTLKWSDYPQIGPPGGWGRHRIPERRMTQPAQPDFSPRFKKRPIEPNRPGASKRSNPRARAAQSPAERGYGARHQAERRRWAPKVAAGGVACARCGGLIEPGMPWDLGHVDGSGKTEYAGPEHRACNRATETHKK